MYPGMTDITRFGTRVPEGIYPTKHTLGTVLLFQNLLFLFYDFKNYFFIRRE